MYTFTSEKFAEVVLKSCRKIRK